MRALVIGYVWPEPASSAAGTRMLELVLLLVDAGYEVTFASAAALSEHRFDLTTLGIAEQSIKLNCNSFNEFLAGLQPEIVLFDRFFTEEQYGWRVEQVCPAALRILDTEDFHSLRNARQHLLKAAQKAAGSEKEKHCVAPVTSNPHILYQQMGSDQMAVREVAAIFRCDLSIMISEVEIDLLQRFFSVPSQLLFYCPFITKPVAESQALPDYSHRQHFITIGNFRHEPNWDSVLWLKHQLWPLIRAQLPQAELHIYGAYPPPKATQLHNPKEGFCIKGWATDAQVVMQNAKICLAPLRFGAGIKGKLMDAMRAGTPSITTSIGAESMHGGLPWGGAIADDPLGIAQQAVLHYRDSALWLEKQQQGFAIVRDYFCAKNFAQLFQARLNDLKKNIIEERQHNFIGQMLRHHSLKSTQYMAQWIEAKNKS